MQLDQIYSDSLRSPTVGISINKISQNPGLNEAITVHPPNPINLLLFKFMGDTMRICKNPLHGHTICLLPYATSLWAVPNVFLSCWNVIKMDVDGRPWQQRVDTKGNPGKRERPWCIYSWVDEQTLKAQSAFHFT